MKLYDNQFQSIEFIKSNSLSEPRLKCASNRPTIQPAYCEQMRMTWAWLTIRRSTRGCPRGHPHEPINSSPRLAPVLKVNRLCFVHPPPLLLWRAIMFRDMKLYARHLNDEHNKSALVQAFSTLLETLVNKPTKIIRSHKPSFSTRQTHEILWYFVEIGLSVFYFAVVLWLRGGGGVWPYPL